MKRVVVKKVGEKPVACDVELTLREMQKAVGGYIEFYPLDKGVYIVVNEEGKLEGLLPNLEYETPMVYEIFVGDVLFVGSPDDEGNTLGLTEKQVAYVMEFCDKYALE
jgi:hypothetical protein